MSAQPQNMYASADVGGVAGGASCAAREKAKAKFISELSASGVQTALATLRDDGLSQQTVNHYLRAVKQFSRWLVKDRRTAVDALQFLQGGNPKTDRRLERRGFTDFELKLLLDAARNGKPVLGLTGWQRFTLYAVALGSGLRASELASLTRRSFAKIGDISTVKIEAADEKARRGDVLPIPPDLAEILRPWLETLGADEPLWPGKRAEQKRASKFVQADLNVARETWLKTARSALRWKKRTSCSTETAKVTKAISTRSDTHSSHALAVPAPVRKLCNDWLVIRP